MKEQTRLRLLLVDTVIAENCLCAGPSEHRVPEIMNAASCRAFLHYIYWNLKRKETCIGSPSICIGITLFSIFETVGAEESLVMLYLNECNILLYCNSCVSIYVLVLIIFIEIN